MQVTSNGAFSSAKGNAPLPEVSIQARKQRRRHRRISMQRTFGFWWYQILLVGLAIYIGITLGPIAFDFPKEIFGGAVALVVIFLALRRLELGLLIVTIVTTAFLPKAFSLKSLDVYPVVPILMLMGFVTLLQTIFRVKQFIWPSFWAIWPLLALLLLTVISNIMIQVTWITIVPHKVNSSPVYVDEVLGFILFSIPLVCLAVTTTALTGKDQYIEYIQRTFLILASLAAVIVIIDFKRLGGNTYAYRFSEPSIGWMTLRAIAQLLVLGALLAYGRLLYARRWRMRLLYCGVLLLCLPSLYFTLHNAWWVEAIVGITIITIVHSRRLFLTYCVMLVPLTPLLKAEYDKLQQVKSADLNRFTIWQDFLRVWSKRPVLGVGPGNAWAYDQTFTKLPQTLSNFARAGLGLAHNGYLQALAELGVVGLCVWVSMIVVFIVIAAKLYRYSKTPEAAGDRMLALIGLGLLCGSAIADVFDGGFFIADRQVGGFVSLPEALTTWIIIGCILYKDQLRRMALRAGKLMGRYSEPEDISPSSLVSD